MSLSHEYMDTRTATVAHERSNKLGEYIRNELEKLSPSKFIRPVSESVKDTSSDNIEKIFESEQEKWLQHFKINLEEKMKQYSISTKLHEQLYQYLETQLVSRCRTWEASYIMDAERDRLTQMILENKMEVEKCLYDTTIRYNTTDKTQAVAEFEKIWTDHFLRDKAVFDPEIQWKQMIRLVFRLYQVLNNDPLPSLDDVYGYLSFLISITSFGADVHAYLIKIRDECVCRASYPDPVVRHSSESGRRTFNCQPLIHFEFIDNEKVNQTWLQITESSSSTTTGTSEQLYDKFCQTIFRDWSLFIDVSPYFETLTKRITEIFHSRHSEEPSFEIILIQEIVGVVNTLIRDINFELSIFQLSISEILRHTLYTCAIISISLFYYNQYKTYFERISQSVEDSRPKYLASYLRLTVPLEDGDKETTINLVDEFSHALQQSFDYEAKEIIQLAIEQNQSTFNRLRFINQINHQVQDASDDWLIRYVLQPIDMLSEQFTQQWNQVKTNIDQQFTKSKTLHTQLLNEFFERIDTLNTALRLSHVLSSSFVNDLFESAVGTTKENLKDKQACMAILFYRYMSGEPNAINITTSNGLTYRVNDKWLEIVKHLTKPSDKLQKIFRSIENQFQMYSISYVDSFLSEIILCKHKTEKLLTERMWKSTEQMFQTAQNRLWIDVRGCTVQCPCCARLCDFDHTSNKVVAIGQEENKHCCSFGHQIQGMGGVRYALNNEPSIVCCEKSKDEEIIKSKGNIQQTWKDFKSTYSDWDFSDSNCQQSQAKTSTYIWRRIGHRLCQYYDDQWTRAGGGSKLRSNHFILLFGYSTCSSPENQFYFQRLRRLLFQSTSEETTATDRARIDLHNHMPEIIAEFVRIRREKCKTDQITFIMDRRSETPTNRTVQLDELNEDQIAQLFSDYKESLDFPAFLTIANRQLAEIKNDPKLATLRHTFLFMVGGKLDTFPFDELAELYHEYRSLMNKVWIITLGKVSRENLERLDRILHGTLRVVEQLDDLYRVYSEIANAYDDKRSTLTMDELVDNTATFPSLRKISTEREKFDLNSASTTEQSFLPITTCEQNQYPDNITIPSTPEDLIYDRIYHISLPSRREDIFPDILSTIVEQINPQEMNTILLPLPIFSKRSIDYLPTIDIKLPLERLGFDLKEFLRCFAQDIGVNEDEIFVIAAEEGSINIKIALSRMVASDEAKLENIQQILITMNLAASKNFVAIEMKKQGGRANGGDPQTGGIRLALENFKKTEMDRIRLTPETIDTSLRMSQLYNVLDRFQSRFLKKKSEEIMNCLIHAFRDCPLDYVLEHALLVYNQTLLNQYKDKGRPIDNEKILFHGTKLENLDGIFQNNFQYDANVKRTDVGWYGRGIYFSSSPRKALNYAKSWKFDSTMYIICSLVAVGKSLTITDMNYQGKEMHPDYDSHYVRTSWQNGEPISREGEPFYEEFVIKRSDRILPLFVVGIRRTYQCAIWRDASITNEANASILSDMRRRLPLNIYESETSEGSLNILQSKLSEDRMNCAVITNGANHGQQFVIECRRVRENIPVVVYCKNKVYHEQWARQLGEPEIKVTGNPEEVFQFLHNALNAD